MVWIIVLKSVLSGEELFATLKWSFAGAGSISILKMPEDVSLACFSIASVTNLKLLMGSSEDGSVAMWGWVL